MFSSVNMSHGSLILRPARRMQKGRGKFLPPRQQHPQDPVQHHQDPVASLVMMELVFEPRWSRSGACKAQLI